MGDVVPITQQCGIRDATLSVSHMLPFHLFNFVV